ncbi:2Fe-2S iron-sulfur cluster binding domain-containing protein [Polaromonas sp. P1(28)-8]|nr:2Fe-2S iron-sulfur cluster binding domain-containing protein [Polaromonas sp. P1(28)-8]
MELIAHPQQRTLDVHAGANLLEVLKQHEVTLSYSCMAGRCGTCRCKVVSGKVPETSSRGIRSPLH